MLLELPYSVFSSLLNAKSDKKNDDPSGYSHPSKSADLYYMLLLDFMSDNATNFNDPIVGSAAVNLIV